MKYDFVMLGMVCALLTGCASHNYLDATASIKSRQLDLPEGNYLSLSWPASHTMYFLYGSSTEATYWSYQIMPFDLDTSSWRMIDVARHSDCHVQGGYWLQRVPTRNVAFLFTCVTPDPALTDINSIYELDYSNDEQHLLKTYQPHGIAWNYSFAPDGEHWIQELGPGDTGGSAFFVYGIDGSTTQIISGFARLVSPSWSPDGSTIAFAGNETLPGRTSSLFPLPPMGPPAAIFEPYNLYLVSPDGENVQEILPGFKWVNGVKWSPRGRLIAFVGENGSVPGIWIWDTLQKQLVRIWPGRDRGSFDWSPDGTQIVITDYKSAQDKTHVKVLIIDVPMEVFK